MSIDIAEMIDELDAMGDGQSPESAMQELLLKHEQEHLHEGEDPALIKVLDEVRAIGHSNIADIFEHVAVEAMVGVDDEGDAIFSSFDRLQVSDITKLPRHISAAIKEVKVTRKATGDIIEVKMYDKLVALDKLLRYYGAYERDHEQAAAGAAGVLDLLMSSIGGTGMRQISDNSA